MISSTPFCSIIIPALNEEKDIAACLTSLSKQTYPRDCYEIIIVDNGSTDLTKAIASKYADHVLEKANCNVGAVRNYGVEKSTGEILICTDADCTFPPAWIETGVNLLSKNKDTVFGGGLRSSSDRNWIDKYWLLNSGGETVQQNDLMGSCIFIERSTFLKSGRFPEEVTSGEDSDISERLRKIGIRIKMESALSVNHEGNPKTVTDFLGRQAWHAENYFKKPTKHIKDYIFIATTIYSITITASLLTAFFGNLHSSLALLSASQAIALAHSTKRIVRSGKLSNFKYIIPILSLDNLYFTGRTIGSIYGITKTAPTRKK